MAGILGAAALVYLNSSFAYLSLLPDNSIHLSQLFLRDITFGNSNVIQLYHRQIVAYKRHSQKSINSVGISYNKILYFNSLFIWWTGVWYVILRH